MALLDSEANGRTAEGGKVGMMCRDDIIGGLQFTAGMVTFNPLDGEAIAPEDLNEQDKLNMMLVWARLIF